MAPVGGGPALVVDRAGGLGDQAGESVDGGVGQGTGVPVDGAIHEGFGLTAGQFMTSFYMITGTHGIHVAGGLIYLIIVYIRASKGQFDEKRHAAPETAAIYWHFVDLVWVFVYTIFYIVPNFVLH